MARTCTPNEPNVVATARDLQGRFPPGERVDLYRQHTEAFVAQLRRCSTAQGSVVVVDLRPRRSSMPGTASWSTR